MRKVELLRLGPENGDLAAGVLIAFLEREQGGGGLAFEAEGGGDFGPFDFEGGASLVGSGLVGATARNWGTESAYRGGRHGGTDGGGEEQTG